jgi:chitin disaccharide deacetylase
VTPIKLCADDYGLSEGVSVGIRSALAAQRLSATSAITTRPHWPQAARALNELGHRAEIGLHLNLSLGGPLSAMPDFAPTAFPAIGKIITRARAGTLPEAEIRAEIARQLNAFEDAMGCAPDFVDGHQHVHVLPFIRTWLMEELSQRQLPEHFWIRDSGDAFWRILWRGKQWAKALVVSYLAHGFDALCAEYGFNTNGSFAGYSAFASTGDYRLEFAAALCARGPRHLIMCHPGHVDDELASLDPVLISREIELAFLLSDDFNAALTHAHATLALRGDEWL